MTSDICYCSSLRAAERRMTRAYDDALAPSGINVAQFSLLRKIQRNEPASLTRIGEIMDLDRSTVGRNIRVLAKLGLTEIATGEDLRESSVMLTEQGRQTIATALPLWQATQEKIETILGGDMAKALQTLPTAF
ncbi:MarR family transcriptional regulator [Devosia epidermidihirudinis]|uniref:MarR family transcriptional regulator n=1 Tax=Devosia epidermidihirudinis TaxID=1293439 RepID=A0A0F5QAV1_9HYPH|nr:MarR family winged helix-turn-helix transcriptional regulator [Devosia epidermidihirudinis]KKC38117.1 MarR family transcriptional regulator [Devosia epidermidihirudinis]